jgi:hypothetical protein
MDSNYSHSSDHSNYSFIQVTLADSGEGVCADPGEKGAILETGGSGPLERGKGRQLAPDSGGEGM